MRSTNPRPLTPGGRLPHTFALALALLSCLPVLVARYPQMSDYPAHLARYHVMLEAGANRFGLILEQAREILRGWDEADGGAA